MAKKKQKYYVVWDGVVPGIYDSWSDCQQQIKGYPSAKYKSFNTLEEAQKAFHSDYHTHIGLKRKRSIIPKSDRSQIIDNSLSVDAACSGSPGILEYRGVWTSDGVEVFRMGPFQWGTNNVGEFLALVHGIAFLQKNEMHEIPIYSDSRTALSWLRNKKVKTTLKRKKVNEKLFVLLDRAELWVRNNQWTNPIIKWDTKNWGEIPADFGRK